MGLGGARDQTTPSPQVLRINSMDVLTSRHLARTVKSPVALAVSTGPFWWDGTRKREGSGALGGELGADA